MAPMPKPTSLPPSHSDGRNDLDLRYSRLFSPLMKYAANTSTNPAIQPNLTPAWSQLCPVGNLSANLQHTDCDDFSIHTTTFLGASVTLDFFGRGIQLFGAVSSGMTYQIILDNGSLQVGNVTGSLLANITNLANRDHTITLSATSASGKLSYSGATIEVGTGLTGATVDRQIIQDLDSRIDYTGPWFNQTFDMFNISHVDGNTTWYELGSGNAGSFSFAATGNAVFVHAPTWSFFQTNYRVSMDGGSPVFNYGNASLQATAFGEYSTDAVTYFNANLSGTHTFVLDNDEGGGYLALDYLEIVTVSGGTPIQPSPSSSNANGGSGGNDSGTNSGGGASNSTGTNASTQVHQTLAKNPGIIVLEVLAGLALILACSFWCLRRRGRQIAREEAVAGEKIAPFTGLPTTSPLTLPTTTTSHPNEPTDNSLRKGPPAIIDRFVPISVQEKERARLSSSIAGEGNAAEGSSTPGEELTHSSLTPLRYQPAPSSLVGSTTSTTTPEIRAIRRDLGQLMQVVFGGSGTAGGEAPPQYGQV